MLKPALAALLLATILAACSSADTSQCSTSKDCGKGQACVLRQCQSLGATSSGGTTSSSSGTGGGSDLGPPVPPTGCLSPMTCASDVDCSMGYHCNNLLTPPQCEQLYCGVLNTICDEAAECATGLECVKDACCRGHVGSSCTTSDDCSCSKVPCLQGTCMQCSSCLDAFQGFLVAPVPVEVVCAASQAAYQATRDCVCNACATQCAAQCAGTPPYATDPCAGCFESAAMNACKPQLTQCETN